jgi:hypothetical protein
LVGRKSKESLISNPAQFLLECQEETFQRLKMDPLQILSASVGVGVLTPDWKLDRVEAVESEHESRHYTVEVFFASPFNYTPVVTLSLTGFDIDQRDGGRVSLKARNVNPGEFTAEISTWHGSRVYAVEFNWLAIGP